MMSEHFVDTIDGSVAVNVCEERFVTGVGVEMDRLCVLRKVHSRFCRLVSRAPRNEGKATVTVTAKEGMLVR